MGWTWQGKNPKRLKLETTREHGLIYIRYHNIWNKRWKTIKTFQWQAIARKAICYLVTFSQNARPIKKIIIVTHVIFNNAFFFFFSLHLIKILLNFFNNIYKISWNINTSYYYIVLYFIRCYLGINVHLFFFFPFSFSLSLLPFFDWPAPLHVATIPSWTIEQEPKSLLTVCTKAIKCIT